MQKIPLYLFAVGLVLGLGVALSQEELSSISLIEEPPLPPPLDLPLVEPADVPDLGTFWTARDIDGPPLPFNPLSELGVPVYSLGNDLFLIDDRNVNYVELQQARTVTRMLNAAASNLDFPDEGEGEGEGEGWTNNYVSPVYGTNDLWLELDPASVTNGSGTLLIHNPDTLTNAVWDTFATTNLNILDSGLNGTNWTWVARTEPGQTNLTVPLLSDLQCYYRLADTNDFDADGLTDAFETLVSHSSPGTNDTDADGLLDGWEWNHFGSFAEDGSGDYDGDGTSNADEQTAGTNPNDLSFQSRFSNFFVNQQTVFGTCEVQGGTPFQLAVLINNTNLATADWLPYSSNFSATLGSTDGVYTVRVVLRGRTLDFPPVWDETEITLDRVAPALAFTNPAAATVTVSRPYLQLLGYADEPLATLAYDLTNAAGSLTNEPGYVVDQFFDTNRFDFTTNFFQFYDVELTNGLNTITLRATDLAGNVTTTNLAVTLAYTGATNPPTLQLIWPTNGMHLSGDSFYVRGQISDETAAIAIQWVVAGVTNLWPGIVERNGMFWVADLPLLAGTNEFKLIATDAPGNVREMALNVVQSEMTVTIDSTPEGAALYEATGTVSGTVADAACAVTVNGVAATVDENGFWTAEAVPLFGPGTATFDAVAMLNGRTPAHLSKEKEMPAMIKVTKYWLKQAIDMTSYPFYSLSRTKEYQAGYEADVNGLWRQRYRGQESSFQSHIYYPTLQADYAWSDTNAVGTYHKISNSSSESSGPMTEDDWLVRTVPDQQLDHTESDALSTTAYYVQHFEARGVRHEWLSLGDNDGTVESLAARTELRRYTGGKSGVARMALHWLSVAAVAYGKPQSAAWYYTPGTQVATTQLTVAGQSVGNDVRLWGVLADNTASIVPLKLSGVKHAAVTLGNGKSYARIFWGASNVTDKTTVAWAGQAMNLALDFDPPLPTGIVASNYQWLVEAPAYADIVYNDNTGTAYALTNTTNSSLIYYWTSEFAKATVTCSSVVNCQTNTAKASFQVRKPEVAWTLTPKHPVAVTNRCDGLGQSLTCGLNCSPNDAGMLFEFEIIDLKDYTNTFFTLKMVQILSTTIKVNIANNTNLSLVISTNGLDTKYPFEDQIIYPWYTPSPVMLAKDSPGESLTGQQAFVWRDDLFEAYLLFHPDNGRPIPLKVASWSWSGRAQNQETNTSGAYKLIPPTVNPVSASGRIWNTPPQWNANIVNLTSSNSACWQTNDSWFPTP